MNYSWMLSADSINSAMSKSKQNVDTLHLLLRMGCPTNGTNMGYALAQLLYDAHNRQQTKKNITNFHLFFHPH